MPEEAWLAEPTTSIRHKINHNYNIHYKNVLALKIITLISSSSSGILPFLKNSRSMTPITWQVAVDDEEQRPLLQDILEAAVDDRRHKI